MIRFIDLRGQILPDDNSPNFAFFNTVTSRFVTIGGEEEWDSIDDLLGAMQCDGRDVAEWRDRLLSLIPSNYFTTGDEAPLITACDDTAGDQEVSDMKTPEDRLEEWRVRSIMGLSEEALEAVISTCWKAYTDGKRDRTEEIIAWTEHQGPLSRRVAESIRAEFTIQRGAQS